MSDTYALFSTSREALAFALNVEAVTPRPALNQALAEVVQVDRRSMSDDELFEELAAAARSAFSMKKPRMTGLNAAAQAGFILSQFKRLTMAEQMVLSGKLVRSWTPCSCGAPCCSGKRLTRRYVEAFNYLDACLHNAMVTAPREGDGSKPAFTENRKLRCLILENFLHGTKNSVTTLADASDVARGTVIKHRAFILGWLTTIEGTAWADVDLIMTEAGIVGEVGP